MTARVLVLRNGRAIERKPCGLRRVGHDEPTNGFVRSADSTLSIVWRTGKGFARVGCINLGPPSLGFSTFRAVRHIRPSRTRETSAEQPAAAGLISLPGLGGVVVGETGGRANRGRRAFIARAGPLANESARVSLARQNASRCERTAGFPCLVGLHLVIVLPQGDNIVAARLGKELPRGIGRCARRRG